MTTVEYHNNSNEHLQQNYHHQLPPHLQHQQPPQNSQHLQPNFQAEDDVQSQHGSINSSVLSSLHELTDVESLQSFDYSNENGNLTERMHALIPYCKRFTNPDSTFKAAQFIVQNAQHLDKSDQIKFCEIAIKALRKLSSQLNHTEAAVSLAHLYVRGIPGFQSGHKPDYPKAFQLYSTCAKKDHVESSFHLALCYEHGLGTQQSNPRAFQWYRKAAMSNHPGAMYRLGTSLLRGELGQQVNARDGIKWLKLAAKYATEQYPQSLYELALLHDTGVKSLIWTDHKYMIELLTRAAELKHAPSQFKLGDAYEHGTYGLEKNPAKSIYYYSLAASNGHIEAMFELGGWYLVGTSDPKSGFTLPQSDVEAYKWVRRAAERKLPRAMFAMGYFCEMGIGQPVNEAVSREWYRSAAEAGDAKAIEKLKEKEKDKGWKVRSLSRVRSTKDMVFKKKGDKKSCVIM